MSLAVSMVARNWHPIRIGTILAVMIGIHRPERKEGQQGCVRNLAEAEPETDRAAPTDSQSRLLSRATVRECP